VAQKTAGKECFIVRQPDSRYAVFWNDSARFGKVDLDVIQMALYCTNTMGNINPMREAVADDFLTAWGKAIARIEEVYGDEAGKAARRRDWKLLKELTEG